MANNGDYCAPATIDQPGITAMQTTAKAFVEILHQIQLQDATEIAASANKRGNKHAFKKGDTVSFFIPPTADQAQRAGRKAKHIAHFKGPAVVIKVLSPTTYAIKHNGKTYGRCASELRAYKGKGKPALITPEDDDVHEFRLGDFVALCDTDDPNDPTYNRFHVGKVINIADDQAHILNYATNDSHVARAGWQVLYQQDDGVYTTAKPAKHARRKRVIDRVDVHDQEYVRLFNVKLTKSTANKLPKLTMQSRALLKSMKLKHHVLGLSFP